MREATVLQKIADVDEMTTAECWIFADAHPRFRAALLHNIQTAREGWLAAGMDPEDADDKAQATFEEGCRQAKMEIAAEANRRLGSAGNAAFTRRFGHLQKLADMRRRWKKA